MKIFLLDEEDMHALESYALRSDGWNIYERLQQIVERQSVETNHSLEETLIRMSDQT